jgi:hypothetical protein
MRTSAEEMWNSRRGARSQGTSSSSAAPHATASAATRTTTAMCSIRSPGTASMSSSVAAPLTHSAPLIRPASRRSSGALNRAPPYVAIRRQRRCIRSRSRSLPSRRFPW